MNLDGRVVIITGAGTGIGRAVVDVVAQAGGRVVAVGRREGPLLEACAACERQGVEALAVRANVGVPEDAGAVVRAALERFGRVDALINNAGVARFARVEDAEDEDLESMLDAHVRGPFYLVRAALPSLRPARGAVVNVSSIGGALATPGRSLYGATKAAQNHLTRSLARELAPEVRVNAILPGPVETPMHEHTGLDPVALGELREEMLRTTPAGRFGLPAEVARWIGYLLDDANRWVTGALFCVDGGRSA